jgi:UDP-glucose:(heptosyl)LPS alpha-1,3-glucosyltransferase
LRRRAHDVRLAASTFAPHVQTSADVVIEAGGSTRHTRYLRFLDALDHHVAGECYDVVHAMLPVRNCDVYHPHAGIAAEALEAGHLKYQGAFLQTVSRVANRLNRRRQRFGEVERFLLTGNRPPIVICLSNYVMRNLQRHYTLPPQQLANLFNAVDLARFDRQRSPEAGEELRARLGIAPENIVALMIANDFERKGLREAIEAVGKVADPRLRLIVVGKQNPRLYRRIAETSAPGQIIFAGQARDPYPYYRAADFFLLPTRHDPCSLVVLEALAMGLPVISTVLNGACEIMTDGREGFILCDPTDIVTVAECVRKILDAKRRDEMSAAALALRPRLEYDRHLDSLEEIYRRVPAR